MERTRPPQPLTAEETQKVLERASHLDKGKRETGIEPALDYAEVERIGLEAGLSKEALQRAFVELRSGALRPQQRGALDKLIGPEGVEVQRPVELPLEQAQKKLEALLKAELLHPEERQGLRTVWSAAPGLWAAIQRTVNTQGQQAWRRVEVVSEVAPSPTGEPAMSVVRLEARPGGRGANLAGAIVPAAVMLPMAVVTALAPHAPSFLPLFFSGLGLAIVGLVLTMVRSNWRKNLRGLRLAIERVLEKLAEP